MTVKVTGQTPLVIRPSIKPSITGAVNCLDTYMSTGFKGTQMVKAR